jgi:hypothetical protein
MTELGQTDREPLDHSCERCGRSAPRLVFDELSKLLLCKSCLERVRDQEAWSLLRNDATV